jgi:trigger factor
MEKKVEKLSGNKVKMNIKVSPKEMIEFFELAYKNLAPTVSLPGFRPGKAPRKVAEGAIGVTRLMSEAIDAAINANYAQAVQENELSPISAPNVTISKYPMYGQTEEEIKENLEFDLEFEVFPEVEIKEYSKEKVELPKKEEADVKDIEKILDNLRKQKSKFTEIDREAKKGDFAEISFEGMVKKVRIDAMCSKHHPLVLGENSLIPGFEEEIIGMKKGEKKTFKIKFPKDYHAKEYAGKDAEFSVELLELKEVELPEIDETFAAEFGQKDEAGLRDAIKKNLEQEMEQKYQEELQLRVIDKVLALTKVEVPKVMVDRELERMVAGYKEQLTRMGMDFQSYLDSTKKTEDDLRKDMSVTAEKNVKVGLMLGKIIKEQGMDPADEKSGKKAVDHLVETLVKK